MSAQEALALLRQAQPLGTYPSLFDPDEPTNGMIRIWPIVFS